MASLAAAVVPLVEAPGDTPLRTTLRLAAALVQLWGACCSAAQQACPDARPPWGTASARHMQRLLQAVCNQTVIHPPAWVEWQLERCCAAFLGLWAALCVPRLPLQVLQTCLAQCEQQQSGVEQSEGAGPSTGSRLGPPSGQQQEVAGRLLSSAHSAAAEGPGAVLAVGQGAALEQMHRMTGALLVEQVGGCCRWGDRGQGVVLVVVHPPCAAQQAWFVAHHHRWSQGLMLCAWSESHIASRCGALAQLTLCSS